MAVSIVAQLKCTIRLPASVVNRTLVANSTESAVMFFSQLQFLLDILGLLQANSNNAVIEQITSLRGIRW